MAAWLATLCFFLFERGVEPVALPTKPTSVLTRDQVLQRLCARVPPNQSSAPSFWNDFDCLSRCLKHGANAVPSWTEKASIEPRVHVLGPGTREDSCQGVPRSWCNCEV